VQVNQACHIVNNLIFRPGWSFQAAPYMGGRIVLGVRMHVQDTNDAPNFRRMINTAPPEISLDVRNMDENDLAFAVKQYIDFINDHEDREFLRFGHKPGYPAPFHPHHPDGELMWRLLQDQAA
jgi:hypothetical protein